jgi:class 3 adenylate cyclase/tetratricopeptide (TPR) repeat protein
MLTCASCGFENPEVARFCMSCAAPLAAPVERREERKVVSVLFADLVGFTSRSERLDVEDVRGTLEPYHAMLRQALERFGGTVEKFIGDAVMAVFGAPVAREDDAERAVRAALAIRDAIEEVGEDLHVRVGVCTGEALVMVGAEPERGEGMVSGDVVNTASRLQGLAPVDGVLVADATFRATERAIVYEPHEPVVAKGKAEPLACWVAREPRSLVPVAMREATPLVGRERERRLLVDAVERCRAERSVQLVTIVGVPGIGKSRLVTELRAHLEDAPEITRWRQGRALSYGEGVAFWPLAEIVKQEAGILESDGAATAAAKLDEAISGIGLTGVDAVWVRRQLAPLAGVESSGEAGGRDEAFAGWRLFVEALATDRATVLVVEDLHWADAALLEFLDGLVERISAVPLLVVCTARPELWERRPGWGGGKPNAVTISLQPLSETETQQLIGALIDPTLLEVEAERELLERADGNPLYAQEYVRMLVERGADASELPESVQGIIAARLDALSPEEKSLLQDAAVIGRTVWLGALCALGARERVAADELVFRLERKQLVRRAHRSSVAGETELSFAHSLIEEVAYAQLTRPQRAERHERAAAWVERLAADRDDRAELIAHHLTTALELRDALGQDASALRGRTLASLVTATRQAAARHDPAAAIALAEQALSLGPAQGVRAELLVRSAVAHVTTSTASEALLVEARDAALAAGLREDAVHAAYLLEEWSEGQAADGAVLDRLGAEALALAAGLPPGPINTLPAYLVAYRLIIKGRYDDALALADTEIERAHEVGNDQAAALMLIWRGAARVGAGEPAGADDQREAYRILDHHAHPKAAISAANLAEVLLTLGRTEESRANYAEGLAWARRIGHQRAERVCLAWLADLACHFGRRDEGADLLDIAGRTSGKDEFSGALLLLCRGRLALPGQPGQAIEHAERVLVYADTTQNDELRLQALALLARANRARGAEDAARAACDAFLERWHTVRGIYTAAVPLVEIGLVLAGDQRHADLARAVALQNTPSPWAEAVRALAEGQYEEAAAILDGIPSIPLRDAARELIRTAEPAPAGGDS